MKRIIVGGDQISVDLKKTILDYLDHAGLDSHDAGTDAKEIVVDYPYYAQKVGQAVASGQYDYGIVICGTGIGVSIAANKVPGVRAALCHNVFTTHLARAHNDANVLALGAWVVTTEQIPEILNEWLTTPFEGERHIPRVRSLNQSPLDIEKDPRLTPDFSVFSYAAAVSIRDTAFGPVLFMGELEEGMKALAKEGFKFIEISLRNADDMSRNELSVLLERYGLQVSAFATGQGCIHDNLCMTATDPEIRQKAVERFKEITEVAAEFKAGVIMGGVRGRLSGSDEEMKAQRDIGVKNIADCAQYARQQGVPFYLEPINRYETNFINTAQEGLRLIDEIGIPSINLLLDTYHMNLEEADLETTIRISGGRIGYFHLVDSNRQAPGQGHLDLKGILSCLYQTGYRGFVSAEILPLPESHSALRRTANFLSSLGSGIIKQRRPGV